MVGAVFYLKLNLFFPPFRLHEQGFTIKPAKMQFSRYALNADVY